MSGCTLQRPDPAASSAGSRPESAASQRGAARSGAGRRGGGPPAPTLRCPGGDAGTPRSPAPYRGSSAPLPRPERGPIGFTPGCRCHFGSCRAPVMVSVHPSESFQRHRGGGAGPGGGMRGVSRSRPGFWGGHSCLLLSTNCLFPAARFYARPRKAALGHPPPLQLLCALGDVYSPPSCSPMTCRLHQRSPLVGKAGRRS